MWFKSVSSVAVCSSYWFSGVVPMVFRRCFFGFLLGTNYYLLCFFVYCVQVHGTIWYCCILSWLRFRCLKAFWLPVLRFSQPKAQFRSVLPRVAAFCHCNGEHYVLRAIVPCWLYRGWGCKNRSKIAIRSRYQHLHLQNWGSVKGQRGRKTCAVRVASTFCASLSWWGLELYHICWRVQGYYPWHSEVRKRTQGARWVHLCPSNKNRRVCHRPQDESVQVGPFWPKWTKEIHYNSLQSWCVVVICSWERYCPVHWLQSFCLHTRRYYAVCGNRWLNTQILALHCRGYRISPCW